MMEKLATTKRTQVERKSDRANYELPAIFSALDEALIGTITFHDSARTHAIPTAFYLNGSRLNKIEGQNNLN